MWKSHVYGHHDKMARKKHRTSQNTEYTKTDIKGDMSALFISYLSAIY